MANYCATTRSNYFRVKRAEEFEVLCEGMALNSWTKTFPDHPGDVFYAITADTGDCAGWPTAYWSDELNDFIEFDIEAFVQSHLDPRDVAVLLEVGNEKYRYLNGFAVAIHATKPPVRLSLDDIAPLARVTFGADVTLTAATY